MTFLNKKGLVFNVNDKIKFSVWDDNSEIELNGIIVSINGKYATVEHKYGIANVNLELAQIDYSTDEEDFFDWKNVMDDHYDYEPLDYDFNYGA